MITLLLGNAEVAVKRRKNFDDKFSKIKAFLRMLYLSLKIKPDTRHAMEEMIIDIG